MGKVASSSQKLQYRLAKDHVAEVAEQMGYKLFLGEADHILAHATLALSGNAVDYTGGKLAQDLANVFAEKAVEAGSIRSFVEGAAAQTEGRIVKKTIGKGLNKIATEQDLRLAAEIAMFTGGHMGTGATLTSHGVDNDLQTAVDHGLHLTKQRKIGRAHV